MTAPPYGDTTGPDGIAPGLEAEGPSGFVQIPDGVLLNPSLDAGAVRLYGVIKHYAGQRAAAWPGRKRLAGDLNAKSIRTVDKYLGQLIDAGYLTVSKRYRTAEFGFAGGDGGQTSSFYYLRWTPVIPEKPQHNGRVKAADEGASEASDQVDPPCKNLHGGVQDFARGGAENCTGPVQELAHHEPQPFEPTDDDERLAPPGLPVDTESDGQSPGFAVVDLLANQLAAQAQRHIVWNLRLEETAALARKVGEVGDVQPFVEAALRQDASLPEPGATARAYLRSWLHLRVAGASAAAAATAPAKLEWCGTCDSPGYRYTEDAQGRAVRCQRCNPPSPAF